MPAWPRSLWRTTAARVQSAGNEGFCREPAVNPALGLTDYCWAIRLDPSPAIMSQSAMRQQSSLARLLASAALTAILAAGLGGCQTMSDITDR